MTGAAWGGREGGRGGEGRGGEGRGGEGRDSNMVLREHGSTPLCPGSMRSGDLHMEMGGACWNSKSRSSSEQYRSSPEESCF